MSEVPGEFFDGTRIEREPSTSDKVRFLSQRMASLTPWEVSFIQNIAGFRQPTPKQTAIVDQLFDKLARTPREDF